MLRKITAIGSRRPTRTRNRPWCAAVARIVNFEANVPNGGIPLIARNPANQRAAVIGTTRDAPRTSSTRFEPKASSRFPAVRNNSALATE